MQSTGRCHLTSRRQRCDFEAIVCYLCRPHDVGGVAGDLVPEQLEGHPRLRELLEHHREEPSNCLGAAQQAYAAASLVRPPADVGHVLPHWPVSTRCRRLAQACVGLVPAGRTNEPIQREPQARGGDRASAEDADPLPGVIVDFSDEGWQHWGYAHCGTSCLSLPECI